MLFSKCDECVRKTFNLKNACVTLRLDLKSIQVIIDRFFFIWSLLCLGIKQQGNRSVILIMLSWSLFYNSNPIVILVCHSCGWKEENVASPPLPVTIYVTWSRFLKGNSAGEGLAQIYFSSHVLCTTFIYGESLTFGFLLHQLQIWSFYSSNVLTLWQYF